MVLLRYYSDVVDEIFLRKVYGEPDLRWRTVIDVGSGIGDSCLYFADHGASKVYGYEIDRERYWLAQENVKLNNMGNKVIIFNEEANSQVLKDFIMQYRLKDVFLKLDCEGCEYEIIRNIDDLTYESINGIVLEYHKKADMLIQKLSSLGFTCECKKSIIAREGILFAVKKQ